jgi:hypothetical protein
MVQRRIFRAKMDQVEGSWTGLHNEEFYNVYASPNIIRAIKSRRMRWAEHETCSTNDEQEECIAYNNRKS